MNGAWVWTTLTLLTGMLFYSFLLFNALRCLDGICQFVMFGDINSLNVVIYLSHKKKKKITDVVISITTSYYFKYQPMSSFSNDSFHSKCKLKGEVMSSRPTLCVHNLSIKNKNSHIVSVWQDCFCQLILLFSLFLLLFMGSTILFGTIHRSYCTISANYIYLRYSQQKVFSFSKINGSQTDP